MAKDLFEKCHEFYQQPQLVKAAGAYPFFQEIEESAGAHVHCHGKRLIMAGSNNYLGLTHHPRVKAAAVAALERYGTGCSGSRFLNGNTSLHVQLERNLARFVGKPETLVFSTGFMVNHGTIGCLFESEDCIFSDADNHASIIDGCRQSRGRVIRYAHADAADCRAKIDATPCAGGAGIVTDGVFSMTGNIAPLRELVAIKRAHPHVRIYVDDAHGLGVFGETGRGITEHWDVQGEVDLLMGTFSKSFASIGGFVAGEPEVIEYIRHKARPLWFSASIPAASAAAAIAALEVMSTESTHREQLWRNCAFARHGLEEIGMYIMPSKAPILALWVGAEGKAFKLTMALRDLGVFATPVAYPAVPYGHALIRTSYMASHTTEDIAAIIKAFDALADPYQIRTTHFAQDPATLPPADYYDLSALFAS
ncbi:MAG: pyridoxal phosphate-dependent aminotransferase family protein [Deltaproteobacteria bacterium]|nr:pyridoxal phosphate-dependent aminotransferase family protein [Deltaproteobacteria bacterium]